MSIQTSASVTSVTVGGDLVHLTVVLTNSSQKPVCIPAHMVPGMTEFDFSQLQVVGPNGQLDLSEDQVLKTFDDEGLEFIILPAGWSYRKTALISDRFIFVRGAKYKVGIEMWLFDCTKSKAYEGPLDSRSDWFLGVASGKTEVLVPEKR